MRKKILLGVAGVVAGLAVLQTVAAQTPPATRPIPATPVRPAADRGAPPTQVGNVQVQYGTPNRPANAMQQPQDRSGAVQHAGGVQQAGGVGGRPRMSTAVVAGADGVRPASAFDLPPANLDLQNAPPGVVPQLPTPNIAPPAPSLAPPDLTPPVALPPVPTAPGLNAPTVPVAQPPELPPLPQALPPVPVAEPETTSNARPIVPVTPTTITPTTITPAPATITPPALTPVTPAPVAQPTQSGVAAKVTQTVTLEAVSPESIVFGGEFRYELIVKNAGTTAVTGVRVEDEVPAGAKYLGSEPQAELNADRLAWAVGTLEAGAEKRIVVRVKPGDEGELRSRAVVSYVAAVEARTKVTRPRIGVVVTGAEVAKAGEEPTFQIKITNTGTGPALGMTLQAFLSDGLAHPAGAKLEIKDMPALPPGETRTIPLKVAAAKAGPQWCQVVVAAQGSQDATGKASVNVLEPQLHVTQTGPAKCLVRAEPVYEITLANPGTAATDPVGVYAAVPEGFEFVQASEGGAFNATNRAVVWKLAGLAPGGSKALTVKLRATAEADGALRTVAQAVPEQPAQGIAPAGGVAKPAGRVLEAKAETAVKAEGIAAVRFEVLDLDDPVEVGKEVVYEVRVVNQGTGACTNVQLVAGLPEGCTFTGSSGPTQVKGQGQALIFDPIPNLGVKGEAVYKLKLRGAAPGDTRFRVQLTCDQVRTPVVKEENTRFVKP
ncbi:hypothetical protein [Gemmata sp.]|uniref:hypothetical protein n=1 Tax=Gemmata sp. TaxID=1914242 RepID=UPI003F711967